MREMLKGMYQKDFLSMGDISPQQLKKLLRLAMQMKKDPWGYWSVGILKNKSGVLIFQLSSSRTWISFTTGIAQLGGFPITPQPDSIKMGTRERPKDIARTVSGYSDFIVARVSEHEILEELAKYADIPVINALSNLEHPCQILGDLLTIREAFGKLNGLHLAFVGDGSNNVCNSLILGAALSEMKMTVCCPEHYDPDFRIVEKALNMNLKLDISISRYPESLIGADIIYTDVWTSMGQEGQKKEKEAIFRSFQVDSEMMARQKPGCIFMHCLPAGTDEDSRLTKEVTEEVYESEASKIWVQAENRLHVQKALMAATMNERTEELYLNPEKEGDEIL